MSIDWEAGKSLANLLELGRSGLLKKPERPKSCRSCGEEECYWAHGSYLRHLEEGEIAADIRIPRWKCKWCGGTVSIAPWFVVRGRRYTVKVIAAGVEAYATEPTTYRREVVKLGEAGPSPVQLFQWVKLLVERAGGFLLDVQAMCISAGEEPEGLLDAERAVCPNAEKAITAGKPEKLNALAKVLAFARVLFKDGQEFVLERLVLRFLREVQRQIFASQVMWMQTPQRRKPSICKIF